MTGVLPRTARELVPETLFHRLAASITAAHGEIDHDMAERITCETLKFLAACATDPDGQLAPSPLVDVGWHAFLVHTREYAEFCRDVAGQFIHHVPRGQDTPSTPVSAATVRGRTLAAIRTAGYAVDPELWPVESATCDQDSCSASGQDGNENTDTQLPPPLGR